jgi:hypothetical protein
MAVPASLDEEALRVMKETAVFDKPFIKKTAWVGANYFPDEFAKNLKSFRGATFLLLRPARKLWLGR